MPSVTQRHCFRCGRDWWPRKPGRPLRCGKCKSPYWATPKRYWHSRVC